METGHWTLGMLYFIIIIIKGKKASPTDFPSPDTETTCFWFDQLNLI